LVVVVLSSSGDDASLKPVFSGDDEKKERARFFKALTPLCVRTLIFFSRRGECKKYTKLLR